MLLNIYLTCFVTVIATAVNALKTITQDLLLINGKFGFLMQVSNLTSSLYFQIELQLPFNYITHKVIHRSSLSQAMSCSYGTVIINSINTSYEELNDSFHLYHNNNNKLTLNQIDFYYLNNNTIKYNAISLSIISLRNGVSILNALYNGNHIHTKQFHFCFHSIYFGDMNPLCTANKHKITLVNNDNLAHWSCLLFGVYVDGKEVFVNKKGSVVYFKGNDYAISVPKCVFDVIEKDVINKYVEMNMCNDGFDVSEMRKFYACAKGVRDGMEGAVFWIGEFGFNIQSEELFWDEGSEIYKRFVIVGNVDERDMSFTMGTQFLKQFVVSFEYNEDNGGKRNLIHFYSNNTFTQYNNSNNNNSYLKYNLIISIYVLLIIGGMDIKPYDNYTRNNYRETYQQALTYKQRFEKNNDPILQRDPRYLPPRQLTPLPHRNTIDYDKCFNLQEHKHQQRKSKYIHHIETTPDPVESKTRRFNDNDLKERINKTQRNTYGIRIIHTPNESTIGKILASTDDCPVYKERFHHKKAVGSGIPTKYYNKMVSKKLMLPHQVEPPKYERDKTPPPVNKETFNKIFVSDVNKDNNKGIVDLSEFKKHRINKGRKDNVGKIISYENGPKYRDNYKIPTKPNRTEFNDIVKGIKQNRKDIHKYYEYINK